jgi:hypothetical protein
MALPFWPWGPAAAFNGTAVTGLALSGWCLYALARGIGLARGPAFVAGMLYLLWPIHLIALHGHLEKLFIGLLPLALLAGLRAFDPSRRRGWLFAPAAALLALLLQHGNQFLFAALGLALLGGLTWYTAPPAERRPRVGRMVASGGLAVLACLPLLLATIRVMRDPALQIALGEMAFYYSPDALSLVLPAPHQWWTRWLYPDAAYLPDYVWASTMPGLNPTRTWYGTGLETAVGIPLMALGLGVWGWRDRAARIWIVFGLAFAVLSLGPRLRVNGVVTPVRLPYVVAKRVPGLDVIRTPGRYMLLAAVGLALGAGAGLAAITRRYPTRSTAVVAIAATAVAVECWPHAWFQTALPRASAFYDRLAATPPDGAILDLPQGWGGAHHLASAYMYFQTIHRRPIAWGYLAREYRQYPNAGLEALWQPALPGGPALRERLQALGYRYVVVHRRPMTFAGGWVHDGRDGQPFGPEHQPATERLIAEAFAGEAPTYQDDLIAVWRVPR